MSVRQSDFFCFVGQPSWHYKSVKDLLKLCIIYLWDFGGYRYF